MKEREREREQESDQYLTVVVRSTASKSECY